MFKKITVLLTIAFVFTNCVTAQEEKINAAEAKRLVTALSTDEMRGRKTFSPEIDKAAEFIAAEFKAAGLVPVEGSKSFLQPFSTITSRQTNLVATVNGASIDAKRVLVVTSRPEVKVSQVSGYGLASIKPGENLFGRASALVDSNQNLLVFVDTTFAKNFPRLSFFNRNQFPSPTNVIFILGAPFTGDFSVESSHVITEQKLSNVVGIIPGKSRKNEYVIFSGHYDHIGIGKAVNGDSIYNGANDDAAGTSAVIMLAQYYKALNNNERTLVFATFTAEEIGGFGSQYFSKQFDPAKVMAMFNIEMIGTESKWGKNSAYITGFDRTDMGAMLQKNLAGTGFTFHPDPYPSQQLFFRSDNATLARLGVPAHTISTAKMDAEPHYHKPSDEVSTLDMENMAMIVRSIALSARGIVAGKETPGRVDVSEL